MLGMGMGRDWEPLCEALLAFARSPGKYAVRRGEPGVLYTQLDTVAQWALGKLPEPIDSQHPDRKAALTAAAVLYVQRLCFGTDNTHYQTLGLTPETLSPELLRTRYRALIRLTHPDMGVAGLPANAAGLVNRAHEVLANPELRKRYDEQLAKKTLPVSPPAGMRAPRHRPPPAPAGWGRVESWLARYPTQFRIGMALAGALTLTGGMLWWATYDINESRMLVVARTRTDERPAGTPPHPPGEAIEAQRSTAPSVPPLAEPAMRAPASVPAPAPAPVTASTPAPTLAPALEVAAMASSQSAAAMAVVPAPIPVGTAEVSSPQSSEPVWTVDVTGAKQYLSSVLAALEAPAESKRVNAYLATMKVKGSLLSPAIDWMPPGGGLRVEQADWKQQERAGALTVETLVVAHAPQTSQSFRLAADFRGTKDGTVLDRLELRREP